MALTVKAVYENGVLRPAEPLPLKEHEKVQVTVLTAADVQAAPASGTRGYGLIRWTGPLEDLDYLIEDEGNDPLEGP
jgi:predicted DNA-binding antitoxin AbrB/MazE fold protein